MSLTPDPVPAIEARHEEYVWTGEEHVVHFVGQIHRDRATLLAIVRELRAENERLRAQLELADLTAKHSAIMDDLGHRWNVEWPSQEHAENTKRLEARAAELASKITALEEPTR